MRVLNDQTPPAKDSPGINPLAFVSQALLVSIGMGSFAFAPLAFLYAYLHSEAQPARFACLFGALVALTFLELPVEYVIFFFALGTTLAELAVEGRYTLWGVIARALSVAIVVFIALIVWKARDAGLAPAEYWDHQLASFMMNLSTNFPTLLYADPKRFEQFLRFQAPVIVPFLWTWYSVGLAAHVGWFPADHPLSGEGLRAHQAAPWSVAGFLVLAVASFFLPASMRPATSALLQLGILVFYVQGFLLLSAILSRKQVAGVTRRLIYALALIIGIYPLAVVGLLGTAIGRKTRRMSLGSSDSESENGSP